MRILIALTYYRPHYSGLTIYAEREARALADLGHEVTVLTSRYNPDLPEIEFRDGVQIIRPRVWFRLSKGVIMPSIIFWAWRLARQSDIVHLHVPQLDAALISLIGRLLKKPIVLTYHCDLRLPKGLIHKLANWVSDMANEVTARLSDLIITNTRDYAQNSPFLRRFLHKVVAIYPPIEVQQINEAELADFQRKYNVRSEDKIIGMVARLATEKGVEHLVQALSIVMDRFPTARVLFVGAFENVVGEVQYARRIMPMIESLGNHWSFLGTVSESEKTALFHTCEVLALPSLNRTESYGMALVEAMACGTPVVASDLPGVRVPILQTGSGLLVSPGSSAELAEALIKILEDPGKFKGYPEELVQDSSPKSVAERYDRLMRLSLNKEQLKEELRWLTHESTQTPE